MKYIFTKKKENINKVSLLFFDFLHEASAHPIDFLRFLPLHTSLAFHSFCGAPVLQNLRRSNEKFTYKNTSNISKKSWTAVSSEGSIFETTGKI